MNRVGMIVDLAHVSAETMRNALEVSKAPVIFSHSNSRTVYNNSRNVPDDVLLKLKENNGIIMVNFASYFLTDGCDATLDILVEHLNYIRGLIGSSYIGLGGDFDGVSCSVVEIQDVSAYPVLFDELYSNHGWGLDELAGLASENILRVMEFVEGYAKQEQKSNPIDWEEDWISKLDLDTVEKAGVDYAQRRLKNDQSYEHFTLSIH